MHSFFVPWTMILMSPSRFSYGTWWIKVRTWNSRRFPMFPLRLPLRVWNSLKEKLFTSVWAETFSFLIFVFFYWHDLNPESNLIKRFYLTVGRYVDDDWYPVASLFIGTYAVVNLAELQKRAASHKQTVQRNSPRSTGRARRKTRYLKGIHCVICIILLQHTAFRRKGDECE